MPQSVKTPMAVETWGVMPSGAIPSLKIKLKHVLTMFLKNISTKNAPVFVALFVPDLVLGVNGADSCVFSCAGIKNVRGCFSFDSWLGFCQRYFWY